jgi:hypothetical protein
VEAGQNVPQAPLPPRDTDDVIPRFKLLDARGEQLPTIQEEHWVIPGIVKGLRTVLAPDAPEAVPIQAERFDPITTSEAQLTSVNGQFDEGSEAPRPKTAPARERRTADANEARIGQHSDRPVGLDIEGAALLGVTLQKHQAAQALLTAVIVRTIEEGGPELDQVLQWAAKIKSELALHDPVRQLIQSLRESR